MPRHFYCLDYGRLRDDQGAPGEVSITVIDDNTPPVDRRVGDISRRRDDLRDRMTTLETLVQELANANVDLRQFITDRMWYDKTAIDAVKREVGILAKWVADYESNEYKKAIGRSVLTMTNIILILVVTIQMFVK